MEAIHMATNLERVLASIRDGQEVNVTLVTNQTNGVVFYSEGVLTYRRGSIDNGGPPASLSTTANKRLELYRSDKRRAINRTQTGPFGHGQPFDADSMELLGMSIALVSTSSPIVVFRRKRGREQVRTQVAMETYGNILAGYGPSFFSNSSKAVHVISFRAAPVVR